jgi:hypothetical protein
MKKHATIFALFLIGLFSLSSLLLADEAGLQLLYQVEENPDLFVRAQYSAMKQNLPLTLFKDGEYFMHVLTIQEDRIIYAVFNNLFHSRQGFKTSTFEEIKQEYDLSQAILRYTMNIQNGKSSNPENYLPGDSLLLIPDWTADRVLAIDAISGDLVDENFIPTSSTVLSSPKEARISPWGNITISDQIQDVVQEFDTNGVFLNTFAPTGGATPSIMDNIRGHIYRANGNLIVAVGGNANIDAIVEFDQAGNYIGNFIAAGLGGLDSPFGICIRSSVILVSASTSDALHRYDLNGNFLDIFTTVDNFPQQVIELPNGNVAVANFGGQSGVLIYDASGAPLDTLTGVTGLRGTWQLGNGNFIATTGTGIFELDANTGAVVRTIYSGASAQFVNLYVVPAVDARVQLVHNSADPNLDTVDVYVDDSLFVDNFAFRQATPFFTFQAGVQYLIGFAPSNSSSASDTLRAVPVDFEAGRKYIGFASGVLDTTGFFPNPDGEDISLTIHGQDAARETSQTPGSVEFFVLHGITDVQKIDIYLRDGTPLFDNILYGDATNYITVAPDSYIVDIKDSIGSELYASFKVDLTNYADSALAVFASGFAEPDQNQNGPEAGLWVALPSGTVFELPIQMTDARVQLIHNSPDPALDTIDVYIQDSLFIDDFVFRHATPFMDLPAGVPFLVGFAPANSSSSSDTIVALTANFDPNAKLIGLVSGVLDTSQFFPNPSGESIALDVFGTDSAREVSQTPGEVEFFVMHGVPDAPRIDVVIDGLTFFFDDIVYTEATNYIWISPSSYVFHLFDSTSTTRIRSFQADLSTFADSALTIFASGFLDPTLNQNGPELGLFLAEANGQVTELPIIIIGIEPGSDLITVDYALHQNYPNPFNPSTIIKYDLKETSSVRIDVYNLLGQKVRALVSGIQEAGYREVAWDGRNDSGVAVASGIYIYRIEAGDFVQTRKMILMK